MIAEMLWFVSILFFILHMGGQRKLAGEAGFSPLGWDCKIQVRHKERKPNERGLL